MGRFKEHCDAAREGKEIPLADQRRYQRVNNLLIQLIGAHLLKPNSIPRHLLTLLDERSSETQVEEALKAIQSTMGFKRGFCSARENAERTKIDKELDQRAEVLGTTRSEVRKSAVIQNIYLVSQTLGNESSYEVEWEAKTRLNAAMSKDLFVEHVGSQGQSNARDRAATCFYTKWIPVNKHAELEARLTLFSLFEAAGLTPEEDAVMLGALEGLKDEEIALRQGVSPAAIRKRRQRAFEKTRAVAN